MLEFPCCYKDVQGDLKVCRDSGAAAQSMTTAALHTYILIDGMCVALCNKECDGAHIRHQAYLYTYRWDVCCSQQ